MSVARSVRPASGRGASSYTPAAMCACWQAARSTRALLRRASAAGVDALGAVLRQSAGVADVRYDTAWLGRLLSGIAVVRGVGIAVGTVFSIALIIGFIVAFALKRLIKPLAMIAYPLAGAAAVVAAIYLVETTMAKGGAGAIWGARDPIGLALQGLAGAFGGTVFALLRPR